MDIIPEPKKNVIFDATVLSSMMGCGRYYDLRFNHSLGSSRGKSNSLEVGSLIHKSLEVYYKQKIQGFPRATCIGSALTAGQMYAQGCPYCSDVMVEKPECGHEQGEYPGVQNTPQDSEGYKTGWKFALDTCEQYFKFYENDSFIPLAVESVRRELIYQDDEIRVMWKAKFDLIQDTNQIGIVSMDHKTFKQKREKTKLSNQFLGQCFLLNSRNVIVNKIGLQSSLKIADRLSREVVSYSADHLLEWQSEIVPYYAYKYIQYIESGYWPPNYTHCDTVFGPCMFKGVCESDRGMREEEVRMNFIKVPTWDPVNKDDD